MIMISFDDAVNTNIYEEIEMFLGSGLKNPNGCDIKTTFFVSHQYNNYSMVQVILGYDYNSSEELVLEVNFLEFLSLTRNSNILVT